MEDIDRSDFEAEMMYLPADLGEVQLVDVIPAGLGRQSLRDAVPSEFHVVVEHPPRTVTGVGKRVGHFSLIVRGGVETADYTWSRPPRWRFFRMMMSRRSFLKSAG